MAVKKIFLSSTNKDLVDERKKALDILDQMPDVKAVAMERFLADPNQSKEVCLRNLRDCDAVVLILGTKYGSLDPDEVLSITEIEYNEAKRLGIPIFVFLKTNADGIWVPEEDDTPDESGESLKSRLLRFKNRLDTELERDKFQNVNELGEKILLAIYNYERDHGELGVKISVFQSAESYFRPYLEEKKLFNHCHPFFGREEILAQIQTFLESDKRILILSGRGGVGKSKILYELTKTHASHEGATQLVFLREGVTIPEDSLRQLPARRQTVVVVDDAHRSSDLGVLLNTLNQRPQAIPKLIFTCRSTHTNDIMGQIARKGIDLEEIESLPLGDPKKEDMEMLGRAVLGEEYSQYLSPLLRVAGDTPLVLVIGAKLIQDKEIDPRLLGQDRDFQHIVFSRYQEAIIGDVCHDIDRKLCRDLLQILSATMPADSKNADFIHATAQILNVEDYQIRRAINSLKSAGILIQQGYTLRIVPDLLSDHILREACIGQDGEPTGYADHIYEAFRKICPENIISNMGELDWQIRSSGSRSTLMDNIWADIEDKVRRGTNLQRVRILDIIRRNAYFLPDRSLELVEYVMRNPSEVDEGLDGMYIFRDLDVRKKLAPVFREIAYHIEYLPRCCDLLWELARGMPDDIASEPEHPIRILANFASYRSPQPVQSAVLDGVSRWLMEPDAYDRINSLLGVLNPILARAGTDFSLQGLELTVNRYRVQYDETRPLRERAIKLLVDLTRSGVPRVILAALDSLEAALRPPLHRREIPSDEMDAWYPEYVKLLEVFEGLASSTSDPVVLIHLAQRLNKVALMWKGAPLAEEINRVLDRIPNSFEMRVTGALLYRFGSNLRRGEKDDLLRQAIQEYLKVTENGAGMFDDLNARLDRIQQAGVSPNPGRFIYRLSRCRPGTAREWTEKIILSPDVPLALYLCPILSGLREDDRELAVHFIRDIVGTANTVLIKGIATGYAEGWWEAGIQRDEIDIVQSLLEHPESAIRQYSIATLGRFPAPLREEALALALDTDIGNDPNLASSLCALVFELNPGCLTNDQLGAVLSKLKKTVRLDCQQDLWISQFLEACAARVPEKVVDLFMERITIAASRAGAPGYQPFSYLGLTFSLDGIYRSESYPVILCNVRDRALETYEADDFWMPHLYADLSNQFSPESVDVLEEWIDVEDEKRLLCVGYLLQEAPVDFLFTHMGFVSRLIERAHRVGCYEAVCEYLTRMESSKTGFSTAEEPLSADAQKMRDSARECMERFPRGSPSGRFYAQIIKNSDSHIELQEKISEKLHSSL